MDLSSLAFLIFTAVSALVYYLFPKEKRSGLLLVINYFFYAFGGAYLMLFILFTTLSCYFAGLAMEKAGSREKRKRISSAVLTANFLLLFLLKYTSIFSNAFGIALPLGISFYIFQSAGYVLDVARGKIEAERSAVKFGLFVSFFPQLIQGPISRYGDLAPQLAEAKDFDATQFKYGIQLAMMGYFKKLVIADRAGVIASEVYKNYANYSGCVILAGVLFYSIQIYCDFSGGIDIARGVAEMFGVELTENFRRPILATSLTDYWRRWHISLGSWMKDYVFYPLILSRPFVKFGAWCRRNVKGRLSKILPSALATFIVYLLIGVWHGSGAKYIAFGLYNGVLITLSQLWPALSDRGPKWFRVIRTWILVIIGRFMSRAEGLRAALSMYKRVLTAPGVRSFSLNSVISLGLDKSQLTICLAGLLVLLVMEFYQEKKGSIRDALEDKPLFIQWLWIVIPLAALVLFGLPGDAYVPAEFIYKAF